jgi:hypothetical protein
VRVSTVAAEVALAEGYEPLATGGWAVARDALTELLDRSETPEALDGLGQALRWLGTSVAPSSIASARAPVSAVMASSRGRLALRSGSRASTRSRTGTRQPPEAGSRGPNASCEMSHPEQMEDGLISLGPSGLVIRPNRPSWLASASRYRWRSRCRSVTSHTSS